MNTEHRLVQLDKRVNGKKFYAVEIVLSDVRYLTCWDKMEAWCRDTIGESNPTNTWPSASTNWFMNNSAFWFREESDMMAFILRFQ